MKKGFQKVRRLFGSQNKNNSSLNYAQSSAEGILNRPTLPKKEFYALRTCGSWLRSRAVKALSSASASNAPKATSMQLCCLSSTVEQTMEMHSTAAAGRIQRRRGASKMRLR